MTNRMRRTAALLALLLLCLSFIAVSAAEAEDAQRPRTLPEMRLHQIDIGCADAYLLTAGDTVILVDCGQDGKTYSETGSEKLFAYLAASGIDHMDAHIVTHWHKDHACHIRDLSELYGTEDTVVFGVSAELPERYLPLPRGTYRQMKDGDRLTVGPFDLLCVGPSSDEERTGTENPDSLNVLVTYGAHTILFTGDWVDYTVRRRWADEIRDVDVLSFPHHGLNPMCIRAETMRTLNPRVILIPGGLSSEKAVKSFVIGECGVSYYPRFYSNNDGNIQVISDGVTLRTAYGMKAGEFPAGKPVNERVRSKP
ncbi:MAG: MBL fold metallo-hydrolase [Clostridia bacterium]|nr:MBL fold metallo-hydrolase [Clostridia bacterium]